MLRNQLRTMLVLASLGLSSGCAGDGLKMPLRNSFASLGSFGKNTPAGSQELSKEFREAQKEFTKDPEGSLLAWARWQEDIGEYAESRKRYRELLIAYPDNVEAQLGLARIEVSCGRVKQAEDILLEVATKRPENAPVRLELGRLYTQQEEWDKAIAAFEAASAVNPEDQVCRYELGIAFARSHRFDLALSHLTYAVGESAAHYNIGYIMYEQGKTADAAEWFQNALQSHPDPRTAERTRAMLAQLTPKNTRDRSAGPKYPSAEPSPEFLAARDRNNNANQFEPRSLDTPAIRPAESVRVEPKGQVLPFVANSVNPEQYSSGSPLPPVTLPPVSQQPLQQGIVDASNGNPFQTVSHSAPQDVSAQPTVRHNQPPQWKSAADQTSASGMPLATEQSSTAPTRWRSRQN